MEPTDIPTLGANHRGVVVSFFNPFISCVAWFGFSCFEVVIIQNNFRLLQISCRVQLPKQIKSGGNNSDETCPPYLKNNFSINLIHDKISDLFNCTPKFLLHYVGPLGGAQD